MPTNSLFEPFKRNHAKSSKPLGTWTTRQNAEQDPDEEDDDE